MKSASSIASLLVASLVSVLNANADETPRKTVELWPAKAPGETKVLGPEADTTKPKDDLVAEKRLIRLGNVSQPTLTVYPAPKDKNTGTAVLVCPGGGYNILAMDLEGSEVCEWLNSIGVTGLLLKYRVPRREGLEKHTAPLQDAQRAMGIAREHAAEWGFRANRIGDLGFSAGGHLAAVLASQYASRTYTAVDSADPLSCKPDFSILIYPAYLVGEKETDKLAPEFHIDASTPPTFIAMSVDDPVRVENGIYYTLALKQAKVPVELHLYPTGGHGYGLRLNLQEPVTWWPKLAESWLHQRGLLTPAK
ncbi:MAG TPA: alpha/beta hydrolase [Candidatus Limnocylindria bacterium]|nr:alpha/beta hydrolase [Candidatus Limnocylindria bacterium]